MKKIFLLILSIAFVFSLQAQNLQGYYVTAYSKLEAKRAFVIDLDTFYATTQLSGIDTILATKEYVKSRISDAAYDAVTWDGNDTIAPSKNAIRDKINSMEVVDYCPDTTIVNTGTISAGSIDSICTKDGNTLTISEAAGTDPLRVTFTFTNVERMNYFLFYGQYSGGATHILYAEIYNPSTLAWDYLGQFGLDGNSQWHVFPVFLPDTYISGGQVQTRISHQGSGNASHSLILDYVDINFGGGGGGSIISASEVTFSPTGNIAGTNVQAAIQELDTEKVPTTRTLTINGTAYDLSADRSWTVSETESYISNLVLSGNTLTSTGVGSAFNSTVGNIANTAYANTFTDNQTIAASSPVLYIKDNLAGSGQAGLFIQNSTTTLKAKFNYSSGGDKLFIVAETGEIGMYTNSLEALNLATTGQLKLPQYTGTTFDGTITKYLGVDASGNVVKGTISTGVTDHSALSNLSYATSGHTDFVSTNTTQDITGQKTFSSTSGYVGIIGTSSTSTGSGIVIRDESNQAQNEFGYNNNTDERYIWGNYSTPLKVGVNAAERLRIKTTGQLQLNNYTSSSAFTGTAVAQLQVDASGNVVTSEIPATQTGLPIETYEAAIGNSTSQSVGIANTALSVTEKSKSSKVTLAIRDVNGVYKGMGEYVVVGSYNNGNYQINSSEIYENLSSGITVTPQLSGAYLMLNINNTSGITLYYHVMFYHNSY